MLLVPHVADEFLGAISLVGAEIVHHYDPTASKTGGEHFFDISLEAGARSSPDTATASRAVSIRRMQDGKVSCNAGFAALGRPPR